MRFGKFLVVVVFALAVCFVMLHFFPNAAVTAFHAPTYNPKVGVQFDGWAITWVMIIFLAATFGGYKMVQR